MSISSKLPYRDDEPSQPSAHWLRPRRWIGWALAAACLLAGEWSFGQGLLQSLRDDVRSAGNATHGADAIHPAVAGSAFWKWGES